MLIKVNVLKILFKNWKVNEKLDKKLKTWKISNAYQTKAKFVKVLQILHGHSVGFYFLIYLLKPSQESLFLISTGICSQIFGPK